MPKTPSSLVVRESIDFDALGKREREKGEEGGEEGEEEEEEVEHTEYLKFSLTIQEINFIEPGRVLSVLNGVFGKL